MIVVDASVLANALTDDGPVGQVARAELALDAQWSGPEHVVVEVFSAIRGRLLGGKISDQRAEDAVQALSEVVVELSPTGPLLSRMWELRDYVGAYDAAYVATAEDLGCPLVTADARLSRATGLLCSVRVALPGQQEDAPTA